MSTDTLPAPGRDDDAPLSPAERLAEVAEQLFFIVGCGRSGTTLLQSALCAHDDVTVPPETKFYPAFYGRRRHGDVTRERTYLARIDTVLRNQAIRGVELAPERFEALARAAERSWDGLFLAVLAAYADVRGVRRVGEKSPSHTPFVGHLARAFPAARFVHVLRDPRAVVHSRITAGFGTHLVGPNVERWREAIEMHDAHAVALGDRYLLVRYEDLVTDLEPTLRAVCAHIGLEFRPEMLEPHRRGEKGFAARSSEWMENTLKPIFTSSVEKWREKMPAAQVALVEHALGAEMERMGYAPTGARTSAPGLRLLAGRAAWWCESRRQWIGRGLARLSGGGRS